MTQKEMEKLSDRELLVKTFGDVEHIKGVLGNGGGGVVDDVRQLEEGQKTFVTRKELALTISIISLIFLGLGLFLYLT